MIRLRGNSHNMFVGDAVIEIYSIKFGELIWMRIFLTNVVFSSTAGFGTYGPSSFWSSLTGQKHPWFDSQDFMYHCDSLTWQWALHNRTLTIFDPFGIWIKWNARRSQLPKAAASWTRPAPFGLIRQISHRPPPRWEEGERERDPLTETEPFVISQRRASERRVSCHTSDSASTL